MDRPRGGHQVPALRVRQDGHSPGTRRLSRPPRRGPDKTQGPDRRRRPRPHPHGLGAAAKRHRLGHRLRVLHLRALPRGLPRRGLGDDGRCRCHPLVYLHLDMEPKGHVHHPGQPARPRLGVLYRDQEERHRQDVGRLCRVVCLRLLSRLRLPQGAATTPTKPYPRHVGQTRRPARCRLQRPPIEDCHWLRRLFRQGLLGRHTDEIRLRARTTHRFHLLHRGRRRRLPRHRRRGTSLCSPPSAHHHPR